jgi:hypothetical protein
MEGEAVTHPSVESEALRCTIRQKDDGVTVTVHVDARPFASEMERILWNEPDLYDGSDGAAL